MQECYDRATYFETVNGQRVERILYRRVEAGMVPEVYENIDIIQEMPSDWTPSPTDVFIGGIEEENVTDLPGYTTASGRTTINGVVVSSYFKYFYGLINKTTNYRFIIDYFEFMPPGWVPTPGVHLILNEDVVDPTVYE
jgi:hypothetical protein